MADVKVDNQTSQSRQQQRQQPARRDVGIQRHPDWGGREWGVMSPFSLMRRLSEEMDRAFASSFGLQSGFGDMGGWSPAVEVHEKDNNLVVCAELPGITKDDVKVEVTDEGLIIEGEKRREHEEQGQGRYRSERSYGHFYRMIPLPEGIDPSKANAQFKDGVLEVKILLPESRKPRSIPIQS